MNDSGEFQPFLNGNFGALVFIVTYIGFYGLNLIIYFSYQFMSENSNNCEDEEISNEFFSTLHHINERQQIYNRLTDEKWIKNIYQIYYGEQLINNELIEEKVRQCTEKYHQKLATLRSKHVYYVENCVSSTPLVTISSTPSISNTGNTSLQCKISSL